MPKCAIITPTYNRAENGMLLRAMLSVSNQSYGDFLYLVVDDGSTDDTPDLVANFARTDDRVRYARRERNPFQKLGASVASNYGVRVLMEDPEFSGMEYVTFLHSDDMFTEKSVEKRIMSMKENPKIQMTCGYAICCDRNMKFQYFTKWPNSKDPNKIAELLRKRRHVSFPNHAVMLRKGMLKEVDGFDENLAFGKDRDFSIRVLDILTTDEICFIPEILYLYRIHDETVTGVYRERGTIKSEHGILDQKNGVTRADKSLSTLHRFVHKPYSFLPEPVKARLRPIRDAVLNRTSSERFVDPFVEEIERYAEEFERYCDLLMAAR